MASGGNEKPQIGWFWNYVEQCSQAEKAEVRAFCLQLFCFVLFCFLSVFISVVRHALMLCVRAVAIVVDWHAVSAPHVVWR